MQDVDRLKLHENRKKVPWAKLPRPRRTPTPRATLDKDDVTFGDFVSRDLAEILPSADPVFGIVDLSEGGDNVCTSWRVLETPDVERFVRVDRAFDP